MPKSDRPLGGFVFKHQFPPKGVKGSFNLADMGAVIGVRKLADGGFRDTEPPAQRHVSRALGSHSGIKRQLGSNDRGQRHEILARRKGAWNGNISAGVNVSSQGNAQGVLRKRECLVSHVLPSVPASGTSGLERRRGHNIAAVALANKNARAAWAVLAKGSDFDREHEGMSA